MLNVGGEQTCMERTYPSGRTRVTAIGRERTRKVAVELGGVFEEKSVIKERLGSGDGHSLRFVGTFKLVFEFGYRYQ